MKISNFKYLGKTGTSYSNYKFKATVEVTTGLFKNKTVTRLISRDFGGYWFFIDTGNFTPGSDVEKLERIFLFEEGLSLDKVII